MTTRITAGAILECNGKVLLLKRAPHKKLAPNMWAGIGGHLELSDIQDPRALNLLAVCQREVQEEANIPPSAIANLTLRYIAVRKADGEIRWHHHFIGQLSEEIPPPPCDEGTFHWVEKSAIPALPMTPTVKEAFRHWLANPHADGICLLALNKHDKMEALVEL